jgi:uncharacterized protein YlxW (UPF0749 family)
MAPPSGRWARALREARAAAGIRLVVLVVASLVGFLLVGQLRTSQRVSRSLAKESEGDLARILSNLNTDTDNLRDQVGQLKLELFGLQTSTQRDQAAARTAQQQLQTLQILAGTVPATGPGVQVTINDPQASIRYDLMIDLVQELRDAGAEAIAVDNKRVGATTAFAPGNAGVVLSGPGEPDALVQAPYRVSVIGNPDTLASALGIPGGALDTLQAQRGVNVDVQRAAKVDVPALASPPTFRVARPVGSGP